jgi:site-specific DNA recombinase
VSRKKKETDPVTNQPVVRCAIYTRKSTTENLDMAFNSLDAQREACEAYITSQKHEGWIALPEQYDDGGYSGGDIDRPAFQRLLADIKNGLVDNVVVYKVDRLSRSLMDFVGIMETFERNNVSFVSVTQLFNTGNSMGRLMLNILLSFAQFERELISERTRDKIAAARKKGKWAGGYPILGYDIDPAGRRLIVNDAEAEQVRHIFDLYLKNLSLGETVKSINEMGWTTKTWKTIKGHLKNGVSYNRDRVHRLLTNVLYIGKVPHKDEVYEGEHDAIVSEEMWGMVRKALTTNQKNRGRNAGNGSGGLLTGIIRCSSCDSAMVYTYTMKGDRRYRYYVCSKAQKNGWKTCPTRSVPAGEIEDFVVDRIRDIGKNPKVVEATIRKMEEEYGRKRKVLESDVKCLRQDIQKLVDERKRLVDALGRAEGGAARVLTDRLSEVETALEGKYRRMSGVKDEIAAADTNHVDYGVIKKALADFDPVWDALYPKEQARVIQTLIERIDYNGKDGELNVKFKPVGMKALAAEMSGGISRNGGGKDA